jgi:hypothetical protein
MYAPVMYIIIIEDKHSHAPTINTGMLRKGKAGLPVANGLPRRCESSGKAGDAPVTQT